MGLRAPTSRFDAMTDQPEPSYLLGDRTGFEGTLGRAPHVRGHLENAIAALHTAYVGLKPTFDEGPVPPEMADVREALGETSRTVSQLLARFDAEVRRLELLLES